MDEESASEFGFKPSAFWGHDLAGVRDVHELLDGGGEHGKRHGAFAGVDAFFEFLGASDAADEVDSFAGSGVFDAEERMEQSLLESGHIESADGIGVGCGGPGEGVPCVVEVHADVTGFFGGWGGVG